MKFERSYAALKLTCPKCKKEFISMIELKQSMFFWPHHDRCKECGQECIVHFQERIHIDCRRADETQEEAVAAIMEEWAAGLNDDGDES